VIFNWFLIFKKIVQFDYILDFSANLRVDNYEIRLGLGVGVEFFRITELVVI
jgi:hypothetical protein